MAISLYKKTSNINIDTLQVLDFILKINTTSSIQLEVFFNLDFTQIINKYTTTIEIVNTNDPSIVYSQFTPSISDFSNTKKTINIGSNNSTYTKNLDYFLVKPALKNHYNINNIQNVSANPANGISISLQITINSISKIYGTRLFSNLTYNPQSFSKDFNYLHTYPLNITGAFFKNTDSAVIKFNNVDVLSMPILNINNTSNTPIRNINTDFVYNATSIASYSGTNSYALINKCYFIRYVNTSLYYRRVSKPDIVLENSSIIDNIYAGINKSFNLTLKNNSSVSDTVIMEFPIFKTISNLNITSIILNSNAQTSAIVKFISSPVVTNLGSGKYSILFSYAPTGLPNNTVGTYISYLTITFNHPDIGNIQINSEIITYTNSNG